MFRRVKLLSSVSISGPSAMAKPMIGENRGHLVEHAAERMDAAELLGALAHGQGDVRTFRGEAFGDGGLAEHGLAFVQRGADAGFHHVDGLPEALALLGRHSRPAFS